MSRAFAQMMPRIQVPAALVALAVLAVLAVSLPVAPADAACRVLPPLGACYAYADETTEPVEDGSASAAASAPAAPTGATSVDDSDDNLVDPSQRADNSFIYDTTIESLANEASTYDGRIVQVVGEAIGDLIQVNDRKQNCWIMLSSTDADNPASISVYISAGQASQVDHFGRYGVTGTMLQVRGEFHQACQEHDGLPDIHVTNSAVVARGVENPDQFEASRFAPGIIALIIGGALLGLYYLVREQAR